MGREKEAAKVENLDGLIRKIHDQGLRRAEEESEKVIAAAQEKAAAIIREARETAEREIAAAREKNEKEERIFQAEARTAAREITLRLRESLVSILMGIMRRDAADSMEPKELGEIIKMIVQSRLENMGREQEFDVFLGTRHRDLLFNGFVEKLRGELANIATMEIDERMGAGIRIGVSGDDLQFDVSEAALAETMADYILPRFAAYFREIAGEGV